MLFLMVFPARVLFEFPSRQPSSSSIQSLITIPKKLFSIELFLISLKLEPQSMGFGMQGRKRSVGTLSHCVTAAEETGQVEALFANYGDVEKVNIIEGKGFGFVEMSSRSEADRAKQALNASELKERVLRANEARPPRGGRRGGYRRY